MSATILFDGHLTGGPFSEGFQYYQPCVFNRLATHVLFDGCLTGRGVAEMEKRIMSLLWEVTE